MPEVRLTNLPVIRRYALAVRQEWADAETLLESLEESLAEVRMALDGRSPANRDGSFRGSRTRAAGMGTPPHSDERLREEPKT